MIANRHSQAALLKSQIDQIDHRLKELEKSRGYRQTQRYGVCKKCIV